MEAQGMRSLISNELRSSADTIASIDAGMIERIADVLVEVIKNGNKVIFMGNGGSSADASHLAAEFTGRYLMERAPMPAITLSNIAPVTAIGNDYSFDTVFKRQTEAYAVKGDAAICISTSGNSKNIIEAMKAAKEKGAITISFTGSGGIMKDMADHALIIPSKETPRIQEGYMVAGHTICGLTERGVFGKKAVFIDRDDTIAKDVPYCSRPEDMKLFNGVPKSIAKLNKAGYLVIIITNQSGVSRGKFTTEDLERIHKKMYADIEKEGGKIDDLFYCPHHPDEKCGCRKPEAGMGIAAVNKYKINTKASFMIGNSDADVEFGRSIGCASIKVTEKFTFNDAVEQILKSG
ncbi:MAG: HAD-IIIA family hydrolase [Methanomassiliicoccaceae archaeon]|jgi:D-sedoheptulose 7-phosphate isomerase|nr:HAD-IIIA family hydrolase [Methanomassiliicoccaceae archaeon]